MSRCCRSRAVVLKEIFKFVLLLTGENTLLITRVFGLSLQRNNKFKPCLKANAVKIRLQQQSWAQA